MAVSTLMAAEVVKWHLSGDGHVFLVHGRMQDVVHDAAVVSVGARFNPRDHWLDLLGRNQDPQRHKPENWANKPYAQSRVDERIWFFNVVGSQADRPRELADRLARLVEAIAESLQEASPGRLKPLVVVPVVGTQAGGLGSQRGRVLSLVLDELEAVARRTGVDVALVTPHRTMFSAAQHHRRERKTWALSATQLETAEHLGQLARAGELALFLGAGVSLSAGAPRWSELVKRLAETDTDADALTDPSLNVLDQAQLLDVGETSIGERVVKILEEAKRPSLAHVLLAGLECREVVTTNYDQLYEKAVASAGGRTNSVLPYEAATAGKSWILKMHGDVRDPKSIVLTRRHFVRYDAQLRPAGSMLQSLLLTRHVLVVGASLNDDNVLRLIHEVDAFREKLDGKVGTVLDISGDVVRQRLWQRQFDWVALKQGPEEEEEAAPRNLEIFLDAVAAFAIDDAAWVLDPEFEGMLSDAEATVAEKFREVFADLPSDAKWAGLRCALESHGLGST